MGVDANGAPYEIFKEVKVSAPGSFDAKSILKKAMPYKLALPEAMKSKTLKINLIFMGNYKEPELQLTVSLEELA